jgi:hypothetical protein
MATDRSARARDQKTEAMENLPPKPRPVNSFISASIDELRLSPTQFRVYCHILRRERLFAKPETTAQVCCISMDTLWVVLRDLEQFRMIRRRKTSTTSEFTPTDPSDWDLAAIKSRPRRKRPATGKKGVPETAGCPSQPATGNERAGDNGNEGAAAAGNKGAESISPEGNPLKLIQDTPASGIDALAVFAAYPRKAAKPEALKAINRAIASGISPHMLLEKTQAYAAVVAHDDPRYIPHPATWFNQQRYNDDPSTWSRARLQLAKNCQPNHRNVGLAGSQAERTQRVVETIRRREAQNGK